MSNPILERLKHIYIYLIVWIIIAFIQALLIIFATDVQLYVAITDSLVFNILYALLAVTIWYPIRYSNPEGKLTFRIAITYLVVGVVVVTGWLYLGYTILKGILVNQEAYFQFLNDSFIARLATGILYYGVTLLIYHLFIYAKELEAKKLNETNLNLLVKESELNVLRSQLNPHFLFNSLNSISYLTVSDPARAREMIIKLSEFLRYALKHGEREKTKLAEEISNIELYLQIEKIRFGDKLVFEKEVSELCAEGLIPNMILQPLFENAVKHGVYESTEPITIKMVCRGEQAGMHIEISNNYDPDQVSRKGAGIGLKNVRNRLMLIYGRDDLVRVEKSGNLFSVQLFIPLAESVKKRSENPNKRERS
jgi:two-component system LytT family sensor kinase